MKLDPREIRSTIAHVRRSGEYDQLLSADDELKGNVAEQLRSRVELTDAQVSDIWADLPKTAPTAEEAAEEARRTVERADEALIEQRERDERG